MNEAKVGNALTERAVKAYSQIADSRLRELTAGLIRHLHAFAKEAKLTDQEFETAWSLMAEMAKFTGDKRNEYLLLCDVLGISELIDAINHQRPPTAVGYALVGPFYRGNAPRRQRGQSIVSDDTEGKRVRMTGRVYDLSTRAPVAVRRSMCGRRRQTGSTKTRTITNPTTISEADSRPTKTAPSNWWHCCRHPTRADRWASRRTAAAG
jgi:hypothetical protein